MIDYDLIIIGLGPAGIIAAVEASEKTDLKILCIDKGFKSIKRNNQTCMDKLCSCDERYCNVLDGLGGSSLISGTKFSLFPAGSGLVQITKNENLIINKTTQIIQYLSNHLTLSKSTDCINSDEREKFYSEREYQNKYYESYSYDEKEYHQFLNMMYKKLIQQNVTVEFSTTLMNVENDNGIVTIDIKKNNKLRKLTTSKLILSTGKSGYDFLNNLSNKLNFKKDPSHIEVGVRLEFPSHLFEDIDKYQSDLKLKSGNCRTYCVSKNGRIVQYNYKGNYFTEGHVKKHFSSGFTNLGLVIRLPSSVDNVAVYENIIQNYNNLNEGQLIRGRYNELTIHDQIAKVFPKNLSTEIKNEIDKFVKTFFKEENHSDINIFLLEQDFPVSKYDTDKNFQIADNIYITGSATGKFRGIIQCFVSGLICIENILGINKNE